MRTFVQGPETSCEGRQETRKRLIKRGIITFLVTDFFGAIVTAYLFYVSEHDGSWPVYLVGFLIAGTLIGMVFLSCAQSYSDKA